MISDTPQTFMTFPCLFPIKIIGNNHATFVAEITALARRHFSDLKDEHIRVQASNKAQYIAITITVLAHDQISLDALYSELSQHPDSKMVL